ncbi:MAG: diacylglycerol kinase family protein [Erysipelotrichaceae bacterium]
MVSLISRLLKKFGYAFEGLWVALKRDFSVRLQFGIGIATLFVAWYLEFTVMQLAIVLILIFNVIVIELLNSALEQLVNLVSPQYSPHAKVIKDLGAAAVLMASLLALIIGLMIVGGKL